MAELNGPVEGSDTPVAAPADSADAVEIPASVRDLVGASTGRPSFEDIQYERDRYQVEGRATTARDDLAAQLEIGTAPEGLELKARLEDVLGQLSEAAEVAREAGVRFRPSEGGVTSARQQTFDARMAASNTSLQLTQSGIDLYFDADADSFGEMQPSLVADLLDSGGRGPALAQTFLEGVRGSGGRINSDALQLLASVDSDAAAAVAADR